MRLESSFCFTEIFLKLAYGDGNGGGLGEALGEAGKVKVMGGLGRGRISVNHGEVCRIRPHACHRVLLI